jgi:outer membrane phospholipase A
MLNNKPLFFGYHQKTLWDTNTKSSPVLDTNYNPHIFYGLGMYKNWNWTLGILEHLSNGRTEQESRGLNMSYLQAMRSYQFERIEIDLGVKVFKSYKVDNGSPDLDEYTGTWALFLRVKNFINLIDKEHFLETRLSSGGKWGEDISKGNLELSMHLRATDASPLYFYVQYFTGRNEYLLDYKKYSDSAHIGLSFQI